MDILASIAIRNSISCISQHDNFTCLLPSLPHMALNGDILRFIDVLTGSNKSLLHSFDMISFTFGIMEESDDFVTIVAMAVMILFKRFHDDFIVRQHLNCKLHVKMLH